MQRVVYSGGDSRGEALRDVCHRIDESEGERGEIQVVDISATLANLRARGCLTEDDRESWYSPSWRVRQCVHSEEPSEAMNERVIKKHRSALRSIPGALFRFPMIGDAGESIEAFITDWSPFPAAAALAVHPDHPLANAPERKPPYFTGRYASHPLTGDQLPVWVAPWVKPAFGTGAVIVNPGHSSVDLDFARSVGLPVRFALAEQTPSVDPATWPKPPVLKTGITVRTGQFDGLDVPTATERYFAELSRGGWAERLVDRNLDPILIVKPDGTPSALLQALLSINPAQPFHLFWPNAELERSLLHARMLWRELHGTAFTPAMLQLYQRVEQTKVEGENPELVSLMAGPLDQVGVVKSHMPEQVALFCKGNEQLLKRTATGDLIPELREARALLNVYQFHSVFQKLYSWQKQAIKTAEPIPLDYFELVFVLTGLCRPGAAADAVVN